MNYIEKIVDLFVKKSQNLFLEMGYEEILNKLWEALIAGDLPKSKYIFNRFKQLFPNEVTSLKDRGLIFDILNSFELYKLPSLTYDFVIKEKIGNQYRLISDLYQSGKIGNYELFNHLLKIIGDKNIIDRSFTIYKLIKERNIEIDKDMYEKYFSKYDFIDDKEELFYRVCLGPKALNVNRRIPGGQNQNMTGFWTNNKNAIKEIIDWHENSNLETGFGGVDQEELNILIAPRSALNILTEIPDGKKVSHDDKTDVGEVFVDKILDDNKILKLDFYNGLNYVKN
jgi:hypothetical protein